MRRICRTMVSAIGLATIHRTVSLSHSSQPPSSKSQYHHHSSQLQSRSNFLASTAAILLSTPAIAAAADNEDSLSSTVTAFKLPSGLQYIELDNDQQQQQSPSNERDIQSEAAATPAYGQLVSISYTSYIQLPNSKRKQQFDSVPAFLYKHGNGRCIAGLDEGIHTMRVGQSRRLLIPPKLGYVASGLGPLPTSPWNRYQLNRLLDDMVQARSGTLIMDVKLLAIVNDEADQGYYSDKSLTPEEYETLKTNMQLKAAAAAAANKEGKLRVEERP
ncbi:hypothetical protein MPSEU_000308900 [Mayamaea pseudoterrestris]|nr:hypothetical protein MPSEU_000308900 [Mayamaea pseudoterrestris]